MAKGGRILPTNIHLGLLNANGLSGANPAATQADLGSITIPRSEVFGNFITGEYYDNAFGATYYSNKAFVNTEFSLSPFVLPEDLTIDRIGFIVSSAGAANSTGNILVYDSDINGSPTDLLISGVLSTETTGLKQLTTSYTFLKGKVYWIGLQAVKGFVAYAIPFASCYNFGSALDTQVYCSLRSVAGVDDITPDPLFPTYGTFQSIRTPFVPPAMVLRKA